ncbi:pilus assembly FimT family protein [Geomonas ferrireducens]|uniref:pilus assembly FimT family protein n=1 Tax=Geomonas ferrireducens TaxID=2570227 RepID=UPI0010A89687|nr:pilus assembly protein PylG [Geomonas ferrireducens]
MRARGYSLVEMITIVACLAVLIALGTLMFQRYDRNFRTEAQTRLILTELMKARMNAITQHRATRVKLYRDRFEVYSSGSDEGDPVMVQTLNFPLMSNLPGFAKGAKVEFQETGLTRNLGTVCVDADGMQPALDSIIIFATSMRSGVKDKGNDCDSENITIK